MLLASPHNDSFDLENNRRHVEALVAFAGARDAVLAGDFNAPPGSPPMAILRDSGRFATAVDGPVTFPSPPQRIDHVLASASWEAGRGTRGAVRRVGSPAGRGDVPGPV